MSSVTVLTVAVLMTLLLVYRVSLYQTVRPPHGEFNMFMQSSDRERILQSGTDQRELETIAVGLASSEADDNLSLLQRFLTNVDFLRRLDTISDPQIRTKRFRKVVEALGNNRTKKAGEVLVVLGNAKGIGDDLDRMHIVLGAAAKIKPMPEEQVQVFRNARPDLYLAAKIGWLVTNESPPALDEVRREIVTKPSDVPDTMVVAQMRRYFLTHRTSFDVIRMGQQLAQESISPALERGLFESFFDYHYEPWFGPIKNPPEPPDWTSAKPEALSALLKLAGMATQANIPEALKQKVEATAVEIRKLLPTRR